MKPQFQYPRNRFLNTEEQIHMIQSAMDDASIPHSHDFFELIYISSGKGLHLINDKSFLVSAGDLFMISMMDTHAFHPLAEAKSSFEWINIVFLPEFIDYDITPFISERKYYGTDGFEVDFIFRTMLKEFSEKKPRYLTKMKGYFLVLLTELSRIDSALQSEPTYGSIKKQTIAKQAVALVREKYRSKLGIDEVANTLNISRSYLSKIFRECLDSNFVSFVNQFRLEQSCELLVHTSWPIRQVMLESGFNDEKFFRTYFYRKLGMTPGEYRKKNKVVVQELKKTEITQ